MKNLIVLFFISLSITAFSQEAIKEGIMTTATTMSSENEQVNSQLAMLGDLSTTTYFKGNKSRSEMNNPMAGQTTTIIDNDLNTMLLLMDNPMVGKKFSKNNIALSKEDLDNISITANGETKTVLNYKCVGYDILVKKDGQETKMLMYVTDKITAPTQNSAMLGEKLKGFPLYMIININQMGMEMVLTMEVTNIESTQVKDSNFDLTVPEGYTEIKSPKPATVD